MASNTTNSSPYDAQASTNYKEAFALFDKRGNSRVQVDSLGDLLRACGQNPTLAEIRELEKGVGSDCTSSHFHSPALQFQLSWIDADFDNWCEQLTSRPSPKSLTARAASAIPASLKNTAVVSRSSTRT